MCGERASRLGWLVTCGATVVVVTGGASVVGTADVVEVVGSVG